MRSPIWFVAAYAVGLLIGCATAEPLDVAAFELPDAAVPPSCSACFETCGGLRNDRDAYWCVRNCLESPECADQ